jgi:hypothetical protein
LSHIGAETPADDLNLVVAQPWFGLGRGAVSGGEILVGTHVFHPAVAAALEQDGSAAAGA